MMDALTIQSAAEAPSPRRTDSAAKAMHAAREFESVFLADALKTMFQDIPTDPLGGGTASQSWRELLVDEYAKDMVARGGIGLAAPIARELLQIQEANQS